MRASPTLAIASVVLLTAGLQTGVLAQTLPQTVHGLTLTDSTVFGGGGGVGFRYQDAAGHYADVYVYPVPQARLALSDSARLLTEAEAFVAGLAHGPERGWYDSYQVPIQKFIDVQTARGTVAGYAVAIVFRAGDGTFVSFMHLFLIADKYLKCRLTLPAAEWRESTLPDFALEFVERVCADTSCRLP